MSRAGRFRAAWGAMALVAGLGAPLAAQGPAANPFPHGGTALRVSVLTIGPGSAVFERFGHNALRIQDAVTGMDLAYNWGMFSFDDPNFLGRFLSGDTRYWVEAFPSTWLIEAYIAQDREVTEQVLALTEAQRTALAERVVRNALPDHKYYRYDYFRDNCSTRVRDALDAALDGALQRRFAPITTAWTYRSESVRLTEPSPFAQTGIEFALGAPADRPLTAWESMFIPMRLRDHLREVTVPGADGRPVPLVVAEEVLYRARRAPEAPERRGLALGAWGPLLALWMLMLVPVGARMRQRARRVAAVMAGAWYGLTGLLGLVILLMWLFTAHVFWARNLNLLLLSPLALPAAVPVARALWRGVPSRAARIGVAVAVGQALLAALLAFVVGQRLAGPLLLLLPAHLALGVAFVAHTRGGATATGARA